MKKTIVIFSNPFGYGPTGKAIAIGKEFIGNGYSNVTFAGSSFVREIVPPSLTFVGVNERDEKDIGNLLRATPNPVVISSQNRFAIKAARSLNIPCAFIDGLSWFWKEIPEDHLIADEIFWMNYPGLEKKLSKSTRAIHLVPAIIDIQSTSPIRSQILIHLGGCRNPLMNIFPKNYLDLLSNALSGISHQSSLMITGGVEVINYLKTKLLPITENKIVLASLKHDEFTTELDRSIHFVTTAGQTATLEAFALGVPTSFLLPMNLSQLALTDLLSRYNAADDCLRWDNYILKTTNSTMQNEKDALVAFNVYAETIKTHKEMHGRLTRDIVQLISVIPERDGQKDFIDNLGVNGAKEIGQILSSEWSLV